MITSAHSVNAVLAVNQPLVQPMSGSGRFGGSFPTILDSTTQLQRHEAVRQAATQLVASALIMPVLASLRESPFLEPPFAPGFAERRFAPLLDQQIADRIVGASNFSLVDTITKRFAASASLSAQTEATSRPTQELRHEQR